MDSYNYTDQLLHFLCQPIAKVNRTFVNQMPDDSHTNLYFDPVHKRILGRWILHTSGEICLTLNITTLEFEWIDRHLQSVQNIPSTGKVLSEIEKEIGAGLDSMGLASHEFYKPLHFKIPDYGLSDRMISIPKENSSIDWMLHRYHANMACYQTLGAFQAEGEVRIWPHHFDTGIYFEIHEKLGIGFGLAMQDDIVGSPYFYMAGYSKGQGFSFDNLPHITPGKWIVSENWQGAVLPLNIIDDLSINEQRSIILDFSKKASWWYNMHSFDSSKSIR